MKIYNLGGRLIFDGSELDFLQWFHKIKEYTMEYSFVNNNTNEIYTVYKLYELSKSYDFLCKSFTMIKTEKILSEFEKEYMPEISAMRKEIREYCDNGLVINHNIDTLGLYNAYTVLIEIEQHWATPKVLERKASLFSEQLIPEGLVLDQK
jgi:hypothetical protein